MWKRRLIPVLFGLGIVALLSWIRIADPYPVQALRDIAFDGFQRLAPRTGTDLPVRIVDIDEASLAAIGQWPWPRDTIAELDSRLTQLGAAAVVFDVLFSEPDRMSPSRIAADLPPDAAAALNATAGGAALPDYDVTFANALAASPSVLGFGVTPTAGPLPTTAKAGFAIVGPNQSAAVPLMPGAVAPLPLLAEAAHGIGNISLDPGGNVGSVRRLPLLWSNGTSLFPSLTLEALRIAQGAGAIVVFTDAAGAVQSVRVGSAEIPTTPAGELLLYYQRTPDNLYVPAKDILSDAWQDEAPLIQGNIVFIGTSATGLLDIRGTPLGSNMPGVEIHAQAIQQILTGQYLKRADWVSGLEILAFIIIGIAIVLILRASGPLVSLFVGGALGIGVAGASWLAFRKWGLQIDPTFPMLGGFIVYSAMIFFQYIITDADKRKIRGAFGFYVAPALLLQIERNSAQLTLGGETRELTIMFSDVRNFTTLSEGLAPPELVALLNTLFGALGNCVTDEYGTIDKFIGDAMMAFWNAPVDVERHPLRACLAALEMRRTLAALNRDDAFHLRRHARSIDEIKVGIGISTGQALVGNLGLDSRFDYSCVGDTVNIAARVEAACKTVAYDIVVVESTRAAAPGLAFLEAGAIELKGKTRRERIHILVGDAKFAASAEFAELERAHAAAIAALTANRLADEAIEHCIALVTFPDRFLPGFYRQMRERRADYLPEGDVLELAAVADAG